MNSEKKKTFKYFIIGSLGGILVMYLMNGFPARKSTSISNDKSPTEVQVVKKSTDSATNIYTLTKAQTVIGYVKENHRLPDFYLTKTDAKNRGWQPEKYNLCEVLPGKAIGGDPFGNREKKLPLSSNYFEADVNYNCGNRNADRIIFTKTGEVWLTTDHYKTFQKQ